MMQSPELNLTEMLCWDLKRAVLGEKKANKPWWTEGTLWRRVSQDSSTIMWETNKVWKELLKVIESWGIPSLSLDCINSCKNFIFHMTVATVTSVIG